MALKKPEFIIEQINQIIRDRIQQGIYSAGCRMPSEATLADEFGVSRTSIRNAMDSLVSEGVIIRRHGDGTFINKRVFEFTTQLKNLWSFPRLIEDSGYTPSVQVLSTAISMASAELARALEVLPDTPLFEVQRLFFADSSPVIYSQNYIPRHLITGLDEHSPINLSIYDLMIKHAGVELSYSTSDIHSIQANDRLAQLFMIQNETPLIQFQDVFYTSNGIPVVFGINTYNDKLLPMHLVRTRAQ